MKSLDILEKEINHNFKNRDVLIEALTHSSYANENRNGRESNERLEFLGDSVVSIVAADLLFERFPHTPEGELSKIRSALVCTASLSSFANQISLGEYLYLGKGEELSGGRQRSTILENAFEALTAAIYLDGGLEEARAFVLRFLTNALDNHQVSFKDYKTLLQEVVQQNHDETLNYVIVGESGPDHDKRFEVEVHLNSNIIGRGIGRSKKQAEQEAAREALQLMGI